MPSTVESEFGPALSNALRDYFRCRKHHAPLPCYRRDDSGPCIIEPLKDSWSKTPRRTPYDEHPLVFSLAKAGCNRGRAISVIDFEGYGMKAIPAVVEAHVQQLSYSQTILHKHVTVCDQCKPSTNTYAWAGSTYFGACHRICIQVSDFLYKLKDDDKVLCIGSGGRLKFCDSGEFMAVSHVWSHGWQGVSEDGICSRVLSMLLKVAADFGLGWIWLDAAMISGLPDIRAMSVNAMNLVYTSAKITLVCDRLLLSMRGGTAREKAYAIAVSDWTTRVWTMQESLLSKNLVILQNDSWWRAEDVLESLVFAEEHERHWESYGAIRTMSAMVFVVTADRETILERIFLLCRDRKTSKEKDLVRALYPLFSLQWPGRETSLVEGQIRLLQHLGQHAARCASLFAPVGLPAPWSWAPLSFVGSGGGLCVGVSVTPDGLVGAWSWKEVYPIRRRSVTSYTGLVSARRPVNTLIEGMKRSFLSGTASNVNRFNSVIDLGSSIIGDLHRAIRTWNTATWADHSSHSAQLASLTGCRCDYIEFATPDC